MFCVGVRILLCLDVRMLIVLGVQCVVVVFWVVVGRCAPFSPCSSFFSHLLPPSSIFFPPCCLFRLSSFLLFLWTRTAPVRLPRNCKSARSTRSCHSGAVLRVQRCSDMHLSSSTFVWLTGPFDNSPVACEKTVHAARDGRTRLETNRHTKATRSAARGTRVASCLHFPFTQEHLHTDQLHGTIDDFTVTIAVDGRVNAAVLEITQCPPSGAGGTRFEDAADEFGFGKERFPVRWTFSFSRASKNQCDNYRSFKLVILTCNKRL